MTPLRNKKQFIVKILASLGVMPNETIMNMLFVNYSEVA